MKIVRSIKLKNGKTRVTVDIDAGEKLASFKDDRYYQMGDPVQDIFMGYVITDAVPVYWCSASQEWVK